MLPKTTVAAPLVVFPKVAPEGLLAPTIQLAVEGLLPVRDTEVPLQAVEVTLTVGLAFTVTVGDIVVEPQVRLLPATLYIPVVVGVYV